MSSTNKTENLQLHSWVRTDPVVCEDFNDNFSKIDEAIGNLGATRGNCEIYSGFYTGTGGKTLTLTFPKPPIYLTMQRGDSTSGTFAGFVVNGYYFFGHVSYDYYNKIYISDSTVTLQESGSGDNRTLNQTNMPYYYMAFAPAE